MSSATVLVPTFPKQLSLVLVRILCSSLHPEYKVHVTPQTVLITRTSLLLDPFPCQGVGVAHKTFNEIFSVIIHVAEPPRITTHPQELKNTVPGNLAKFTIQAIGTEPLSYHWQWKLAAEDGSEEWQPCDPEWSDGATLTIPSVQKSNEGSYRCVIRNCVGTMVSKPAQLSVGKNKDGDCAPIVRNNTCTHAFDMPSTVCSSLAITSEEQARRLRMTQARVEEEVVVSCKLHKKRRKKTKKVSSRYSKLSLCQSGRVGIICM